MDTALILLVILTMILFPIFLVVWIIQAIRKRPTKNTKLACLLTLLVFIISTILAISSTCNHEWLDATCTAPKTCALCGETSGEVLQHQWIDATCNSARMCSLCGLADGLPLEHKWIEASCSTPKTCQICRDIEGDALEHEKGDWIVTQEATVYQVGIREQQCTVCGEVIHTEEFYPDPVFYSKDFGMSTADFVSHFNKLSDGDFEIKPDGDDYVVHWLGTLDISTSISFTENSSGLLTSISLDGREMSAHGNQQVDVCWAMFRVLNPHLSESDSMDEFKYAANSGGKEFIRGVRYLYTEISSLDVLWFTIQID